MRELKIYISDELNNLFRRTAMDVFGYGRGSISKAAEEALKQWCERHQGTTEYKGQSENQEKDNVTSSVRVPSNIEDTKLGTKSQSGQRELANGENKPVR